ncbi:MAG: DUF6774 domain-containing protein [Acutalibacteraceae bacterium]|nr:DUF6774 domain-containing protein [Acutalibacteraceae bacterium]
MNGKCVAAYVTAIATVLSEKFTEEELSVLAVIFTQLGDTLATIATVDDSC